MAGLQHNMMLVNVPFHNVSIPSSTDILYKHCRIPVYFGCFVCCFVVIDVFDPSFSVVFPNLIPCNFNLVLTLKHNFVSITKDMRYANTKDIHTDTTYQAIKAQ